MNRKLTLSVEERAIEVGKQYASFHDTSLSHMVETFLFLLGESPQKDKAIPISPSLQALVGLGAGPADEADYRAHLEARHA